MEPLVRRSLRCMDDAFQHAGEGFRIFGHQVVGEVPGDAAQVDRGGFAQTRSAFRGQLHPAAAAVFGVGGAVDQALGAHAVDEAGEAALAEEDRAGEVGHAQPLIACFAQLEEDVVQGQGQAALAHEVGFEEGRDAGVGGEEGAPGLHAGIGFHIRIIRGWTERGNVKEPGLTALI